MKEKNEGLGFATLVAIAASGAVSGIFSSIGLATGQTGRSAWIAYVLAVLIGGFLRAVPTTVFTSMFRYKGGNYAMAALTLGPLAGGIYAMWWTPMFLARGSAASALGLYINSVFPQVSAKWTGVALTTLVFVVNLFGLKAMSRLQRPLTALTVLALLVFTGFGLFQLQPGAFAVTSPEYYSAGGVGLLMAVTLVIQPTSAPALLCGFSWEAKDPKRDIPRAILVGSGLVLVLFVGVSFVASNAIPMEEMAGKPITYAAQRLLPGALFPVFMIFGPVLALLASLNGTMSSFSAPVLGAIRDGWIPREVGRTNRYGSPWIVYTVMWLICTVPLILGVSLKTFIGYTVMTQRICGLLLLAVAFRVPDRFPREWEASWLHMPKGVYYLLTALSGLTEVGILAASVRATSVPVFVGNLVLVAVLAVYACRRYRGGKTHVDILVEREEDA